METTLCLANGLTFPRCRQHRLARFIPFDLEQPFNEPIDPRGFYFDAKFSVAGGTSLFVIFNHDFNYRVPRMVNTSEPELAIPSSY